MNAAAPLSTKIANSTLEQVVREFSSAAARPAGEDENLARCGELLLAVMTLFFAAEAAKDFVLEKFDPNENYDDVMRREGIDLVGHMRDIKTTLITLNGVINGKQEG